MYGSNALVTIERLSYPSAGVVVRDVIAEDLPVRVQPLSMELVVTPTGADKRWIMTCAPTPLLAIDDLVSWDGLSWQITICDLVKGRGAYQRSVLKYFRG